MKGSAFGSLSLAPGTGFEPMAPKVMMTNLPSRGSFDDKLTEQHERRVSEFFLERKNPINFNYQLELALYGFV